MSAAGFVRQAIGWMTNDEQFARALADECGSCGHGSGEWMRGASFAGGLGRDGAIQVLDQKVISAVELESGGALEPAGLQGVLGRCQWWFLEPAFGA